MHAFFTLMRRELAGFLISITGYVIIAVAVLLMGLSFAVLLQKLQATPVPLMELFFRTVREKKITCFLVTHNEELASRCDRVLRIKGGRV